ncbi:MAG: peptidylprolyl isomerase [Phycisphaerales bacterium]|nr:peptidylprolyl isomerase [Phycisphaerales bacterium]
MLIGHSCIEVRDVGNVEGPQGETDLVVNATTDAPAVFEGLSSAVLTAEASGGTPPYLFRWDQNGGPAVEISDETSATLTVRGLSVPGRYVFRVVATDAGGLHATDYVTVEVLTSVTASAPDFAIVGQPAGLSAAIASELGEPSILWEVTQGTATLDDPTSATSMLTTLAGETVRLQLTITPAGATEGGAATREFEVVSVFDLHPRVKVQTNFGEFVIELDGEAAPQHMVNFLLYADDGFYDGLLFHRNACTDNPDTGACDPFVLQGGGYHRVDGELVLVPPPREPVAKENENSPSNGTLYSVALALTGGDPNSGTTQFFINLSTDNAFLDAQGFTVFGRVVEGTDAVDAIAATPRVESSIISGEVSLPAEDVIIELVTRVNP